MSKKNKINEYNLCDAPIPTPNIKNNEIKINNNIYYNCTECSSLIEILSINEYNNSIEFKCLNQNKKQIMSIKEYLEKYKKYINEKINNEKCDIHKNNKYISYCFDCNNHLCKDCLKNKKHIQHNKNYIIEVEPIKEELDIIKEIIKHYNNETEKLKNEKLEKIKELDIILNRKINNENKIKESNDNIINNNEKNELILNKDRYISEIIEIKKKYEYEIKERKKEYIIENKKIKNKYKLL